MDLTLVFPPRPISPNPPISATKPRLPPLLHHLTPTSSASGSRFTRIITATSRTTKFPLRCHAEGSVFEEIDVAALASNIGGCSSGSVGTGFELEDSVTVVSSRDNYAESESLSVWKQAKEIIAFAGPATGLWICGPLMSLIDTAVIGQSSSLELAALGPGTVVCDYLSYLFMFLSIATSNMIATSLAKKDKNLAQHQISMLLLVALSCGLGMLLFTKFLGTPILTGFIGLENVHLLPAASTYVQIRAFAWPAVLIGMVAQSASLGMKDSWGPLKALAVASAVNGLGDIVLCSFFGLGIAGAAWATMVSQVTAALMMIQTLSRTGFDPFSVSVPSGTELLQILELAGPIFVTMILKVGFYILLTYFATSMGTFTVAAHQVMVNMFCMCTVWAEPLSQTAQSFMPEMLHGINSDLEKARLLLKTLIIIGAVTGLVLGAVGTSIPLIFPIIFTHDDIVIREMHKVLIPYFIALLITPSTLALEGTLLAGRDLRFLSLATGGSFISGGLILLLIYSRGYGLTSCWWPLLVFLFARLLLASLRLTSPYGMLHSDEFFKPKNMKVKAA